MDLLQTLTEIIDLRSFSNLWYWIALAVMWSSASHWILGVPYDMVHRARRTDGQSAQDLDDLVRINVNRVIYVVDMAGFWILGIACFVLSSLATLGFVLQVEFAQAVFLLLFPMSVVGLLNLVTARAIRAQNPTGEQLYRRLAICRVAIQMVGLISIFVTAMWGMYQNLQLGVFG